MGKIVKTTKGKVSKIIKSLSYYNRRKDIINDLNKEIYNIIENTMLLNNSLKLYNHELEVTTKMLEVTNELIIASDILNFELLTKQNSYKDQIINIKENIKKVKTKVYKNNKRIGLCKETKDTIVKY